MSSITESISEMASSIHVKDVLSFNLNAEFLNHNFAMLKQCLLKLQEMEGSLGQEKDNMSAFSSRLSQVEKGIVEGHQGHYSNAQQIKNLQNNVGDDFMVFFQAIKKKMYAIEERTKNIFSFEDTVLKLEILEKFLTVKSYKEKEGSMQHEIQEIKKLKNEFERYVPNTKFTEFKESQAALQVHQQKKDQEFVTEIKRIDADILALDQMVKATKMGTDQNSLMIKQINFPEMLDKNRKFKDQTDQKINDLIIKMKKKVGHNELHALQQSMIDKLDKFLSDNQRGKAEKIETRDALIYLEKRISEIEDYISDKATEEEKEGLFTTKKIHCASCTKDLGKFEGKLGQYKPWSIFPCKELDPEKTGGFGYMGYLDKIQPSKKGLVMDDQTFDRLNKTANVKDKELSPPKRGSSTARHSNVISNYGSEEKGAGVSLKDMYFRELKTQKGDRANKIFRVKKQAAKPMSDLQRPKQV